MSSRESSAVDIDYAATGTRILPQGATPRESGRLWSMTTRDGDKKSSTGRNIPPQNFPTIEGYKFLQTIARSPKSEVYVAYSLELGHNVAIKVLRTGASSGAEAGSSTGSLMLRGSGRGRSILPSRGSRTRK